MVRSPRSSTSFSLVRLVYLFHRRFQTDMEPRLGALICAGFLHFSLEVQLEQSTPCPPWVFAESARVSLNRVGSF